MMNRFIAVLMLVTLYHVYAVTALANTDPSPMVGRIAELAAAHAELDMFSGVVLVAKNRNIIYEEAFGEANKDHGVANRMDTRFSIGSIGKTFTAVSIMQLVEAGELRLSDPLSSFFVDLPFPGMDRITVRQLLNHSSGLGDYLETEDYQQTVSTIHSIADALPLAFAMEPDFPPGEAYQYSNSGFLLLGAIIEKVSGLSYPRYLQKHIFAPLQMNHSGIVYDDQVLPDRAIGYTKNWDGTYTSNVRTVPAPGPAGGLRTTAGDLLIFDQALYGTALLSEESKAIMFTPSELHSTYGLGWETKDYAGHVFVGHSGGADGVEAFFYRFIDDRYTIITLANYDGGNGWVCSDIEAILFGKDYALPTVFDANFALGYALQTKRNHEDAMKVFARNLKSDSPHLMSVFFFANSSYRAEVGLEEADRELDRFILLSGAETFPPVTWAWNLKGSVLEKLGRPEEAVKCYEEVLALDPKDEEALENLARLRGR